MRGWLLIATLTMVGCLDPRTTTCGDLVCPVGKVCAPSNDGCVFPEQLTTCEGAADGAECGFVEVPAGICRSGVCGAPYCGDAIISGAELCDDGNTEAGDGCSSDCFSDERCGNGILDLSQSEECDDGNHRSHDGCSSGCLSELASWSELELSRIGFFWHQLVYDSARRRIVAILGTTPSLQALGQVVVYERGTWNRSATAMPPRYQHVAVYDARRRVVVTFGGLTNSMGGTATLLRDTWEYDGATSVERTTAIAPPARRGGAAAYDAATGHMVMFGGLDASDSPLGDTWIFDGTNWVDASPVGGPPARAFAVMAYDSVRERVVMFGGDGLQDTWEWDGSTWTETTPAAVPDARGAMAFDAGRGRMVLFGGERDPRGTPSDHTWEYDGTSWTQAAPLASPPARVSPGLAYDPLEQRVVLFSGGFGNIGAGYDDTWEYDGTTWTRVELTTVPPKRIAHGMSHDSWRGLTLVFGGFLPGSPLDNDTWAFETGQWRELETEGTPPIPPSNMGQPAYWPNHMTYDSQRGRSMFVASSMDGMVVWALAGRGWSRLQTATAPPGRMFSAIAYDSARDRLVMFGGENGPANVRGDTWEFDGTSWISVTPAVSPPSRGDAAMLYDATRGQVVLFGGRDASRATLDDTWAYDGVTWVEIESAVRPGRRSGAELVYDPARGSTVLFMGENGVMPTPDTWELRDGEWRELIIDSPPPRKSARMAYETEQRRVVLYGGDPQEDTWQLRYSSATPDEVCDGGVDDDGDGLSDCADPDCDGVRCGTANLACIAGACVCRVAAELHCGDDFDDDCDGMIDCADSDCATSARCSAELDCDDALDDDGDGLADCADPGCLGVGFCTAFEAACGDGEDNDGDGAIDCADPDCFLAPCASLSP